MLIGFPDVVNREPLGQKRHKNPLTIGSSVNYDRHTAPMEAKTHVSQKTIRFKPPEILEVLGRLKALTGEMVGVF